MKMIITGTGRSGTSFVARKLFEAGFPIGDEFIKPNGRNPDGYFEDIDVVEMNKKYYNGEIEYHEWVGFLNNKEVAKDPRFADLIDDLLVAFPNIFVVIVERNEHDTIKSLEKTMTPEKAREVYDRRTKNLKYVPNSIRINIDLYQK